MSVPYTLRTEPPPWGGPTALTRRTVPPPAAAQRGRATIDLTTHQAWRRHVLTTIEHRSGAADQRGELAVGFADVSGFSALSRHMAADELARLIRCFEHHAVDVVTAHRGRVVKFIGDEAMYVAESVPDAVDIALTLCDRLTVADVPVDLHCGIAYGTTVSVGGDVFGHTVNVASRLTGIAGRSAVLVTRQAARQLDGRDDLRTRRVLRLTELKGVGRMPIVAVSRRDGG